LHHQLLLHKMSGFKEKIDEAKNTIPSLKDALGTPTQEVLKLMEQVEKKRLYKEPPGTIEKSLRNKKVVPPNVSFAATDEVLKKDGTTETQMSTDAAFKALGEDEELPEFDEDEMDSPTEDDSSWTKVDNKTLNVIEKMKKEALEKDEEKNAISTLRASAPDFKPAAQLAQPPAPTTPIAPPAPIASSAPTDPSALTAPIAAPPQTFIKEVQHLARKSRIDIQGFAPEMEMTLTKQEADKPVASLQLDDLDNDSKARKVLLDPRAHVLYSEFDIKQSDKQLREAQGTLAQQVASLQRKDALRKHSSSFEIEIDGFVIRKDGLPEGIALLQEYDRAQLETLAQMTQHLKLVLEDWKVRSAIFKESQENFPVPTPVRKVCPFPEAEYGAIHVRTFTLFVHHALELASAGLNVVRRELNIYNEAFKVTNPSPDNVLSDQNIIDFNKLRNTYPLTAFDIILPKTAKDCYEIMTLMVMELDELESQICKATLNMSDTTYLSQGFQRNQTLPIGLIKLSGPDVHNFCGFRPEKPLHLQHILIDKELKGNKLHHFNSLPCRERDGLLRYHQEWDLEMANAKTLENEISRLCFYLAPMHAILGIKITHLKESVNEKQASITALKLGRTRLKNCRRLERKATEEKEKENPQTGDASSPDAKNDVTKQLREMKQQMDRLLAAQANDSASSTTNDQSWTTSSSKKKSYYDKEKGGAKKGDKGDKGDKGKKGNKGDKGDKGKGKGKNDKGKGKKK
jgi:hypothetical protein